MPMTNACYFGQAYDELGCDVAPIYHETCKRKGGAIQARPDGFGPIVLGQLCDCPCHARQNRNWYPKPERYTNGLVRPAPEAVDEYERQHPRSSGAQRQRYRTRGLESGHAEPDRDRIAHD